jgi:hypothetical protein
MAKQMTTQEKKIKILLDKGGSIVLASGIYGRVVVEMQNGDWAIVNRFGTVKWVL